LKVLITGGSGYLGVALIRVLREYEIRVLALDPMPIEFKDINYEFYSGSVTNREIVRKAAADVDVVIHLAGLAGVDVCRKNPSLSEKINVHGTRIVTEASKDAGLFIFTSSSAVYGEMRGYIDENREPNPVTIYGKHKLQAEKIVKRSGIPHIILRPSNLYGPSPLLPEKYAIHRMIKDAVIHGKITVSSSGLIRNFIHVRDCARAVHLAMKSGIKNEVFNIGDREFRLLKIAEMIQKILEKKGKKINIEVERWDDVIELVYSSEKFRKATGFLPKVSIVGGLKETIDLYYLNFLK